MQADEEDIPPKPAGDAGQIDGTGECEREAGLAIQRAFGLDPPLKSHDLPFNNGRHQVNSMHERSLSVRRGDGRSEIHVNAIISAFWVYPEAITRCHETRGDFPADDLCADRG